MIMTHIHACKKKILRRRHHKDSESLVICCVNNEFLEFNSMEFIYQGKHTLLELFVEEAYKTYKKKTNFTSDKKKINQTFLSSSNC